MNFIKDLDMNASHIATIVEKFNINGSGPLKCRIPVLMPNIPASAPFEVSSRISKSNLVNKNKNEIISSPTIVANNYISIDIPKWIRRQFDSEDEFGNVSADKQVIFTFIEGDINHIKVLGRY